MKPKYTVIIKDNETNDTLVELNVENTSMSYSIEKNSSHPDVKVHIHAEGFFNSNKEENTAVYTNVYTIDEEEFTCEHQWKSYLGLMDTDHYCTICGIIK